MPRSLSDVWIARVRRLVRRQQAQATKAALGLLAPPKSKRGKRAQKPSAGALAALPAPARRASPKKAAARAQPSLRPVAAPRRSGGFPVARALPHAKPQRGSWTRSSFARTDGSQEGGARHDLHYWLYWPSSAPATPRPLVVMLHGCGQTATEFAQGTRMNELAERKGFAVLYPQQSVTAEASRCWPWYKSANQRGNEDAAAIRGLIGSVLDRYPVQRRRVYVAGLSAGAAMAQILALNDPSLFAAVGMHSGPVYGCADSPAAAFAVMQHGNAIRFAQAVRPLLADFIEMPALLIHGDCDKVVRPVNLMQVARQFLLINGLEGEAARPLLRDHPSRAGGAHPRHGWRTLSYFAEGKPRLVVCQVTGLDHAWSGGVAGLRFNSATGPDASLMFWNFFARHKRAVAQPARRREPTA